MRAIDYFQVLSYTFLALSPLSHASASQHNVPVLAPKTPDVDAISLLSSRTQDHDSIFNEAVKILDSMKASPSCNRLAATKLVDSCQTFSDGKDSTQTESPERLDLFRSVYAARLALCEIDGTGTPMPPSCLPVTVSPPPQKNRFGFLSRHRGSDSVSDEVPKELLEQCLRTLESRPQWWTSYSNSRQNALVICHASRIETEKEELLDLHRSIAKSSLKLNIGIQEALQNATAQSAQQHSFIQAVQSLQEKIVAEMEVTNSVFKRTFNKFLQEIEAGIWSLQDSMSVALSNVRTGTGVLEKDILDVTTQVGALQQALRTAQQDAMARSQESLLVQETNAVAQKDLASSLHLSLESILNSDMDRVYRGMQRFDAAMEWLTSRMNMVLEQETRLTERLQNMETFIQQSESKASELQKAQNQQIEALSAQSRAQEAIQFDAQVSQALLAKTSVAAANLQSVIDDAAFKFKHIPGFGIGGSSAWSLCVVLLTVIASQNLKIAISLLFLFLGHSVALTIFKFL
ncbi:Nuclear membrane fusion protein Kar5, putative [Penicillium digitatum]|uniref:Nuclear membrane fusion protein Kar5, putative n=1 Tax=Penicillium digitatum TaxID=36651 RepID=A0A7T6XK65_PENDI|nr:Nuclear membrane fusion protein Kar5, putative [Penicillium digitatum]